MWNICDEKYTFTKKIYMACVEEKTNMYGGKSPFKAFLKCVSIDDMLIQSYEKMRRWRITKHHKYRADGWPVGKFVRLLQEGKTQWHFWADINGAECLGPNLHTHSDGTYEKGQPEVCVVGGEEDL